MPRVTDFPDQTQSMMQAALQSRAMNQRSDQAFLDAQLNNQGLKQSMMEVMMADRFGRDKLAEGARQFDDSMVHNRDLLTESNRAALQSEEIARDQIAYSREYLAFNEREFDTGEYNALVDQYESRMNEIFTSQAQLAEFQQRQRSGSRLSGADLQQIEHLKDSVRANMLILDDILTAKTGISGISEEIVDPLRNTLHTVARAGLMDYDFQSEQGAGNLLGTSPAVTNQRAEKSLLHSYAHNARDYINRLFSGRHDVPQIAKRLHRNLEDVMSIDGTRWNETVEEDLGQYSNDFARFGHGNRGIFRENPDRRDQNQFANLDVIEGIYNEAALARISDMGIELGLKGNELTEYVHNYMNNPAMFAQIRESLEPVSHQRFRADHGVLMGLQEAQQQLGQEAYMNALQGGPGAQDVINHIRAQLPAASKLDGIRKRFNRWDATHYNPAYRKRHKELIDNLISFGIISE